MGAFIRLNKQDAFIDSYVAHKSWVIDSASFTEYGIEVLLAETGSSESIFSSGSSATTGTNSNQYQELIHSSIQHLYYSGVFTGIQPTSSYEDYPQTTLHPSSSRDLGSKALLVTIPQNIFGNAIKPGTFFMDSIAGEDFDITDNGEGNLIEGGVKVGDIIYPHGQAIFTFPTIISAITGSNFNLGWQSTKEIYTHNYRCRVREQDLNYSQNPSIKSGSNGDTYNFATGSYFQPYITTVGLYNDSNELIAVAKLGQPIPKSRYTDMTFVISLDI